MSLYPSLEDMMVDQMAKVSRASSLTSDSDISDHVSFPQAQQQSTAPPVPSQPSQMTALPYPPSSSSSSSSAYPGLAEYMGLELTEDIIRANMPEYLPGNQQVSNHD